VGKSDKGTMHQTFKIRTNSHAGEELVGAGKNDCRYLLKEGGGKNIEKPGNSPRAM